MKKAQLQQIFIYIFALIVIGLVLYFGVRALTGTKKVATAVEIENFIRDVRSEYETILSLGPGSYEIKSIFAPSGITEICFTADQVSETNAINEASSASIGKEIYGFKQAGSQDNVFIIDARGTVQRSFKLEKLDIDNSQAGNQIVCFRVAGGRFTIRFENAGDVVKISRTF